MKKRKSILNILIIALCLVVGFFIGTLVNFPPADKSELAGTIGKINNYRNVKISENDLKVRNELINNQELSIQLLKYYSFHYLNSKKITDDITLALDAVKSSPAFAETSSREVEGLDRFKTYLEEARKDFLIVISAIRNVSETDDQKIGLLINNANTVISQTRFRGQSVLDIVDAAGLFFGSNPPEQFPELKKAHDLLLLQQIQLASGSGDKMKIKFLDKKEFLGSAPELLQLYGSQISLQSLIREDLTTLGIVVPPDREQLAGSDNDQLGIYADLEKLGVVEDLEKLGVCVDSEKLNVFSDLEKLGFTWDNEKLNVCFDAEKLGLNSKPEALQVLVDSEIMGLIIPDMELLGVI